MTISSLATKLYCQMYLHGFDDLSGSIRGEKLLNSGLDGEVRDERLVVKHHVGLGTGVVSSKPALNLSLFIGVAISADHRLLHDLQRNRTNKMVRNRHRLSANNHHLRHGFSEMCERN